ncbi:hypothetical protein [Pimelobacter simplex]|uniref:hypothetical protein n=1 Tax=Nocardioides simplex TaxID=2045 RepID=UPI003AB0742F
MTAPTTATASERLRWHRTGVPRGVRSWVVLVVLVPAGLTWLGWPVWGSLTAPSRADAQAAAPWLMTALVAGLAALTVAIWLDAGRRSEALAPLAALVAGNTVLRAVLNPAAAGIELVHALPLLAGMAAGAPAGFLVGASSALVSTVAVGEPATMLPVQALVWGLVGMLGGLLRRLRPRAAWLASLPLALVAGLGSGVLLNLMGWGQEPGTTLTSFSPGLPPAESLSRLWGYTLDTSVAYDLTRGASTAVVLAVIGHPVLLALRRATGADVVPVRAVDAHDDITPEAVARRADRDRLDHLWNQGA